MAVPVAKIHSPSGDQFPSYIDMRCLILSVPDLPLPWDLQSLPATGTSTVCPFSFQLSSSSGLWFSCDYLNILGTFSFQIPVADPTLGLNSTYFIDWPKNGDIRWLSGGHGLSQVQAIRMRIVCRGFDLKVVMKASRS